MTSDHELLAAWRTGDEPAGRELFERHFDGVFRFFRNKVDEGAEDLTQQTFLGCVRGKDNFRGDASFRTYLFTIARNRLYTHLRDRQRHRAVVEIGRQSIVELGIDLDAASPTGLATAREEHRLLLKAMRRLPLEMQVALELHYWEGMTVLEIAEVVESASGTVKRRLQRARARLDELIAEMAETEDLRRSTTDNFADWAVELRGYLTKTEP